MEAENGEDEVERRWENVGGGRFVTAVAWSGLLRRTGPRGDFE